MELEQKEGSKLAKIGQIFALKKLNLHFLKNFPRFDFTAFFCDFQCIRPIIIHWQSSLYRTGVVGGLYGWRAHITHGTFCKQPSLTSSGQTISPSNFKSKKMCGAPRKLGVERGTSARKPDPLLCLKVARKMICVRNHMLKVISC